MTDWPWKLGRLPFYYAPLRKPTNDSDLPNSLPFALDIDLRTGTLVQMPNEIVSDAMSKAYLKGSMISGMMDEDGIGREYAEDFLSFLKSSLGRDDFGGMEVLEIGCGTGYCLYRLKCLGAEVLGLEPGAHGQDGSSRFKIPIIRDFFPSSKVKGKFDLVVLYGVLEHVQSSSSLLAQLSPHLKEKGRVVISVPDCEPYIQAGDVSMLMCEHWSYYTQVTLRNSIKRFMGFDVHVERSSFGRSLYAIMNESSSPSAVSQADVDQEVKRLTGYRCLAGKNLNRFLSYFQDAASKGESVGIYVPGRAINALSMLGGRIDLSRVRFFDDNKSLHNTYFPGFDILIESREGLIARPTNRVLIMTRTFGRRIAEELKASTDKQMVITTWEDLFMS